MRKKKNLTFSLTEDHELMIREMADAKDLPYSRLIRQFIEKMYRKYTQKKEESQRE